MALAYPYSLGGSLFEPIVVPEFSKEVSRDIVLSMDIDNTVLTDIAFNFTLDQEVQKDVLLSTTLFPSFSWTPPAQQVTITIKR